MSPKSPPGRRSNNGLQEQNRRSSLGGNGNNGSVNRKMRFDASMSNTDMLIQLKQARENSYITTLVFDEVDFDSLVAAELIDLLRQTSKYGRTWDRLSLEFCEGPIDLIVSSAILFDSLKHLFLASDEKQDDVIDRFATCLRINTSLQSLWLLVPFTETSAELLGDALATNDTLDKLSLSGSTWDPDALNHDIYNNKDDDGESRATSNSNNRLDSLGMPKHSIAESIDTMDTYFTADSAALALAKGLSQNTSIRTLDLSCCRLDDDAMSTILSCLIGHPCLQTIDISRNKCRGVSITALGEMCQNQYNQIKHIDLREQTDHEPVDISRLALSLRNNETLEVLKLSHNQLTDIQVVELVRALKGNATLLELDLQWNQITEKGLNVLTKHLNELSALSVLLLGGNSFGQQGKDMLQHLEDDDESICTISNEKDLYNKTYSNKSPKKQKQKFRQNGYSGTIMSRGY